MKQSVPHLLLFLTPNKASSPVLCVLMESYEIMRGWMKQQVEILGGGFCDNRPRLQMAVTLFLALPLNT